MSNQSKVSSLAEAVVNTALGLFIAMLATAVICKGYGIPMSWENNFIITFWMTVLSIARSYVLRRAFDAVSWEDCKGWARMQWKRLRCKHGRGRVLQIEWDGATIVQCDHCGKIIRIPL